MNVRGLVGALWLGVFTFGGAAPLYADAQAMGYPSRFTLQGITGFHVAANGLYVVVGDLGADSGWVFQRYTTGTNSAQYHIAAFLSSTGGTEIQVFQGTPSTNGALNYGNRIGFTQTKTGGWVHSSWNFTSGVAGVVGATAIADYTWAPPNEYAAAFPDWESAAVKIPLGFGFAMAFWAAAVALSIPMKWVRELTSAAT